MTYVFMKLTISSVDLSPSYSFTNSPFLYKKKVKIGKIKLSKEFAQLDNKSNENNDNSYSENDNNKD